MRPKGYALDVDGERVAVEPVELGHDGAWLWRVDGLASAEDLLTLAVAALEREGVSDGWSLHHWWARMRVDYTGQEDGA